MAYKCNQHLFHALKSQGMHNFHTMCHLLVKNGGKFHVLFHYVSFCLVPYIATDSSKFRHIGCDTQRSSLYGKHCPDNLKIKLMTVLNYSLGLISSFVVNSTSLTRYFFLHFSMTQQSAQKAMEEVQAAIFGKDTG